MSPSADKQALVRDADSPVSSQREVFSSRYVDKLRPSTVALPSAFIQSAHLKPLAVHLPKASSHFAAFEELPDSANTLLETSEELSQFGQPVRNANSSLTHKEAHSSRHTVTHPRCDGSEWQFAFKAPSFDV